MASRINRESVCVSTRHIYSLQDMIFEVPNNSVVSLMNSMRLSVSTFFEVFTHLPSATICMRYALCRCVFFEGFGYILQVCISMTRNHRLIQEKIDMRTLAKVIVACIIELSSLWFLLFHQFIFCCMDRSYWIRVFSGNHAWTSAQWHSPCSRDPMPKRGCSQIDLYQGDCLVEQFPTLSLIKNETAIQDDNVPKLARIRCIGSYHSTETRVWWPLTKSCFSIRRAVMIIEHDWWFSLWMIWISNHFAIIQHDAEDDLLESH